MFLKKTKNNPELVVVFFLNSLAYNTRVGEFHFDEIFYIKKIYYFYNLSLIFLLTAFSSLYYFVAK